MRLYLRMFNSLSYEMFLPVEENNDVWFCNFIGDFDEKLFFSHHDGRLCVHHHHEQVRVQAVVFDPENGSSKCNENLNG